MPRRPGQMSHKERVLAALKRQDVDYVPCSPTFNPLHESQREGYRYQFPWGPSLREEMRYCVEELGIDPVMRCGVGGLYPAAGVSSKVWLADSIIHKVWTTPSGDLHAAVRCDDVWPHGLDIPFFSDFNIGHFVEPWLQTEGDLECLRHILRAPERRDEIEKLRFQFNEVKRIAGRWELATLAAIGSGLTGAHQLCGSEPLCLLVVDNPGLVEGYLQLEHKLNLRHLELAAECGIDIIRRNGFYETCDFFSPAMLGRFLGRLLRAEIDAAHAAGSVIAYIVHTGVMPMLDHLRRLDFDCLMHIDIAFEGVDAEVVRDSQQGAKSFWIGPSGTYHMWSDDPEVVRDAVRQVFRVFGKCGLLITPCPSAHSIMPWENTLAMIDAWRNLR